MTNLIYNIIKSWFPTVYWRIYREGKKAVLVDGPVFKKHTFTPISEERVPKFHLPLYKNSFPGNNQPPMTVH